MLVHFMTNDFFLYFSSMWCFAWMPPTNVFFMSKFNDWKGYVSGLIFSVHFPHWDPGPKSFCIWFLKSCLKLFNIKYEFFLHSGCFYFLEDLIIFMVHTFCLFSLSTPLFLLFKCLYSCLICISLFSPLYFLSNSLSRYIQTSQFVLISKVFFYSVSFLKFNRSYIFLYLHLFSCPLLVTLLNLLHVLL